MGGFRCLPTAGCKSSGGADSRAGGPPCPRTAAGGRVDVHSGPGLIVPLQVLTDTEIASQLADRAGLKSLQYFDVADFIRNRLRTNHGVTVDDSAGTWACGDGRSGALPSPRTTQDTARRLIASGECGPRRPAPA